MGWVDFAGGIRTVGHGGIGFAWDNEAPQHDVPSTHAASPTGW